MRGNNDGSTDVQWLMRTYDESLSEAMDKAKGIGGCFAAKRECALFLLATSYVN